MIATDPNPENPARDASTDVVSDNIRLLRPLVEDRLLERILLEYLVATVPIHIPGGDGMRLCDVLHEYHSLSLSGFVPTREELLLRHSELSEAIGRFFA